MRGRNTYDTSDSNNAGPNARHDCEPTLRDLIEPIVRSIVEESRSGTLLVSQLNCEALLGISRRTHLELCRSPDFAPLVVRSGKLRLVDAAEYRTWLRAVDARRTARSHVVDGASDVLAELGIAERPGQSKASRPRGATNDPARPKVG